MKTATFTALFIALPSIASAQILEAGPQTNPDDLPTYEHAAPAQSDTIAGEITTLQADFRGFDVPETWIIGGDAQLTGGWLDDEGDGWLRLTDASPDQAGYVYIDHPIEPGSGVSITFDYASWGGSGADGFSVFLFDAGVGEPNGPAFRIGTSGGSLGYAQSCDVPGLEGGFLGVGIDSYGNFSSEHCHVGGFDQISDAVVVRGPQSDGYAYVSGTEALDFGVDCPADTCTERPDQDGPNMRRVRIDLVPFGDTFEVSVWLQNGADGELEQVVTPLALDFAPAGALKLGFGASTGILTNVHEIRDVVVRTIE